MDNSYRSSIVGCKLEKKSLHGFGLGVAIPGSSHAWSGSHSGNSV